MNSILPPPSDTTSTPPPPSSAPPPPPPSSAATLPLAPPPTHTPLEPINAHPLPPPSSIQTKTKQKNGPATPQSDSPRPSPQGGFPFKSLPSDKKEIQKDRKTGTTPISLSLPSLAPARPEMSGQEKPESKVTENVRSHVEPDESDPSVQDVRKKIQAFGGGQAHAQINGIASLFSDMKKTTSVTASKASSTIPSALSPVGPASATPQGITSTSPQVLTPAPPPMSSPPFLRPQQASTQGTTPVTISAPPTSGPPLSSISHMSPQQLPLLASSGTQVPLVHLTKDRAQRPKKTAAANRTGTLQQQPPSPSLSSSPPRPPPPPPTSPGDLQADLKAQVEELQRALEQERKERIAFQSKVEIWMAQHTREAR